MLTASRLLTTRVATPSQQHMVSNNLVTKASRQATASSRDTNSRPSHSNKLLLLTLPRPVDHMGSLQPTSTTSKVDHRVTVSPAITVSFAFLLPKQLLSQLSASVRFHCDHSVMTACFDIVVPLVDSYRQDGQGGGSGYPGSEPTRYPGVGDSRGPGRDFDRGGMMHRGRGGMGRGMG